MPTLDELEGVYDAGKSQKVEWGDPPNHVATDLINLTGWSAWASEAHGSDADVFHFGNGYRDWDRQSYAESYRALPVRSGK